MTESTNPLIDSSSLFERKRARLTTLCQRKLRLLAKRQEKAEHELQHCLTWHNLQKEGELLQAHFHLLKQGLTAVSVWDWENNGSVTIALDTKKSPLEELNSRFQRSKKLRKSIPHRQKYLDSLIAQQQQITSQLDEISRAVTMEELDKFVLADPACATHKRAREEVKALPYHEFMSATGVKIWVGKSAKQNDILTFQLARGLDWWLHVHGYPGSHVVIRTNRGEEPDQETLRDAIQLALYYSQAKKQGEGEVCLTQRKFVSRYGKGARRAAGKVQISKPKLIFARLDPLRYQEIRARSSNSLPNLRFGVGEA